MKPETAQRLIKLLGRIWLPISITLVITLTAIYPYDKEGTFLWLCLILVLGGQVVIRLIIFWIKWILDGFRR
jgi:hypothetical protein